MRWTRVLRNVLAGGALAVSTVAVSPGTTDASHNPPAVMVGATSTDIVELGDCGYKPGQSTYRSWIADNETQVGVQAFGQECPAVATVLGIVSFRDTNPAVQVRPNSIEITYDYFVVTPGPNCTNHIRRTEVISHPGATEAFLIFRDFSHTVQACLGTVTIRHHVSFTCLETLSHGRCG